MDYSKAKEIVATNINLQGFNFTSDYNLIDKATGIRIEINSFYKSYGYYRDRDYKIANISFRAGLYPEIRRGVKEFDVVTGDYTLLKVKIDELVSLKKKAQGINNEKQLKAKKELMAIATQLKDYGFKINMFFEDWLNANLELKIAGLDIDVRIQDGKARAEIDGRVTIEKLIPILTALQSIKEV